MVETQVISSLISQWLTPTYLFILLNIVLGTILLLNNHQQSKKSDNNNNDNNSNRNEDGASLVPPPPQLTRAPSLFSRVASFNFSNYYSEQSPQAAQSDEIVSSDRAAAMTVTRAPSLLYRVASFNFCRAATREAAADSSEGNKGNDVKETIDASSEKTSEREVHDGEKEEEVVKVKKVNNKKKKVKKADVAAAVEVEEVKKEKEATTTATTNTTSFRGEDAQVDSKADDFINRFKQNLKMQRLDSLLRYRNYNTVAAN